MKWNRKQYDFFKKLCNNGFIITDFTFTHNGRVYNYEQIKWYVFKSAIPNSNLLVMTTYYNSRREPHPIPIEYSDDIRLDSKVKMIMKYVYDEYMKTFHHMARLQL